jgi:hypothetical protein
MSSGHTRTPRDPRDRQLKVARPSGALAATHNSPNDDRGNDGEDQGGCRAEERFLEVIVDAASFGLLYEPVGQAARHQVGDDARQDRDHALLRLVVHALPSNYVPRLTYPLASVVAVEVLELGAEDGPVAEARLALYARKNLLWSSRVQVVFQHEIQ